MFKRNKRILAIDPGSREMGLAVLDGTDLVYHGVKSLKKFRPEDKLKQTVKEILSRLIIEYGVKVLAVENGMVSQIASPLFQAVFEAIREVAKKNRLKLTTYSPNTVRKFVCQDGKATKRRTARIIADSYAELEIYLEQNYRWKELYWLNAFDAIAVGLTHFNTLKNRK
jgi:Holliday junction resolvasome RuvABC endonuclease subunit